MRIASVSVRNRDRFGGIELDQKKYVIALINKLIKIP
jgi:hypothetical protein